MNVIESQCCIVGGGPAGIMLGYLLARAGVKTVVLEKHADFFRDFRGDTIHPSTLELLYELGDLEDFLRCPHQQVTELRGIVGDAEIPIADFSHLPTHCKFLAFMPQWDFLDFLTEKARQFPTFDLRMSTAAQGLLFEGDQVVGVRAIGPTGAMEIRAPLVVGCDGRTSVVRESAGMKAEQIGAPMDVLWLRLSRLPSDPDVVMGRFNHGQILVMIYRGDFWQCGYVIPKGGYEQLKSKGIEAFRRNLLQMAPFLAERVGEIASWDDVKLLNVAVDRLDVWHRKGLLCIGDAAHAMSPVGGVGINLAIQDAVATANLLATALRTDAKELNDLLPRVQRRRQFPTRLTQWFQVQVQEKIIGNVLSTTGTVEPPLALKLLKELPLLRRIPAKLVGLGVRPEHVRTPNAFADQIP